MSFDLYFVGSQNLIVDEFSLQRGCKKLYSFAEKPYSKLKLYQDTDVKLFIDSGAFSIARKVTRARNLTMDDYIDFINTNTRPNLFASFDVIPYPVLNEETAQESATQSYKNYTYILDRIEQKDKLVPVYHYGEDFKNLYKILEGYKGHYPKYIAFGGRAGVHSKHLYPVMDKFFDILKDFPEIKTHAFGVTVFDLLEKYPWTSADSTSYQKVAVHGGIFLECTNKTPKVSLRSIKDTNHFNYLCPQLQKLIIQEIEKYGYTLQELQESTDKRIEFNIDYFMRWADKYQYKPIQKVKRKLLF